VKSLWSVFVNCGLSVITVCIIMYLKYNVESFCILKSPATQYVTFLHNKNCKHWITWDMCYWKHVLVHCHSGVRTTRTSTSKKITVPWTRSKFGDRSFAMAAPTLWNTLPDSLQNTGDHNTFRRRLKTWLFHKHGAFIVLLRSTHYIQDSHS
jgi:hypothetical protein